MKFPRFFGMYMIVVVAFMLVGCSGLAGEVPIVATFTPSAEGADSQPMVEDRGYPSQTPNVVRGAEIFAMNCTQCHGAGGAGDGELATTGQLVRSDGTPIAVPSFLDAERVRAITPLQYFNVITQGNLDNLMPPWANALTEQERWDVTMYVYTLYHTPDQLTNGQQQYALHCAECHGDTGLGDGEEQLASGNGEAYDLTYAPDMIQVSDNDISDVIRQGKGNSMPPLNEQELSPADLEAMVQYVRMFSVSSEAQAPISTEEATTQSITLQGRVSNGTQGGTVPTDLMVFLRYGNAEMGLNDLSTPLNADGSFMFENVPLDSSFGYIAVTGYNGVVFSSEVLEASAMPTDPALNINIYERTDDISSITISNISTQIEPFPEMEDEAMGTGLLISQVFTYNNSSDRAFLLEQNGVSFTLLVQFPPGSIILSALQDPRYIVAQEQYAIIDTFPVNPGQHTVEVTYFLPYADGAVFDQPLNTPFIGTANVNITPKSVKVLESVWALNDSAPFVNQYSNSVNLPARESFKFTLDGRMDVTTSTDSTVVTAGSLIPLIAITIIIFAVFMFLWMKVWSRSNPEQETQLLLRQIAELDSLHDQGQINHDAYQRQRQALKSRLTVLMASSPKEN
jgi:mono/diheme cytochrome c family protein